MLQPQYEILPALPEGISTAGASLEVGRIVPIYEAAGNGRLTSRFFRRVIHYLLETLGGIADPLPPAVAAEYRLIPRWQALRDAHFPPPASKYSELETFRTPAPLRRCASRLKKFCHFIPLARRKKRWPRLSRTCVRRTPCGACCKATWAAEKPSWRCRLRGWRSPAA